MWEKSRDRQTYETKGETPESLDIITLIIINQLWCTLVLHCITIFFSAKHPEHPKESLCFVIQKHSFILYHINTFIHDEITKYTYSSKQLN